MLNRETIEEKRGEMAYRAALSQELTDEQRARTWGAVQALDWVLKLMDDEQDNAAHAE